MNKAKISVNALYVAALLIMIVTHLYLLSLKKPMSMKDMKGHSIINIVGGFMLLGALVLDKGWLT